MMFVPDEADRQFVFWRNELKRYKRFYEKHKDFITYYESNATHLDGFYFIKVTKEWKPPQPMPTYDSDTNYCSSHDHLVRGLLANKMYYEYVKEKLAALKT